MALQLRWQDRFINPDAFEASSRQMAQQSSSPIVQMQNRQAPAPSQNVQRIMSSPQAQAAPLGMSPVQRPKFIMPTSSQPSKLPNFWDFLGQVGGDIGNTFVKPVADFGIKTLNTTGYVPEAIAALVQGKQNDKKTRQHLADMLNNSLVSNRVATGKANPLTEFAPQFIGAGMEAAQYVPAVAGVGKALGLGGKIAAQGLTGAGLGAGQSALNQYNETGQIDPGQVFTSSLTGGLLGALMPAVEGGINRVRGISNEPIRPKVDTAEQPSKAKVKMAEPTTNPPETTKTFNLVNGENLLGARTANEEAVMIHNILSGKMSAPDGWTPDALRTREIMNHIKSGNGDVEYGSPLLDEKMATSKPEVETKSKTQEPEAKPKVSTKEEPKADVQPEEPINSNVTENPYSKGGTERPLTNDKDLLNIKRRKAKDPVRKAELQAEWEGEYGSRKPPVSMKGANGKKPKIDIPDEIKPVENEKSVNKASVFKKGIDKFASVSHRMTQYGAGGKYIEKSLQAARTEIKDRVGTAMQRLDKAGLSNIKPDDFRKMVDAIESGTIHKLPSDHQKLANTIVSVFKDIHRAGTDAKMDIGNFGEKYFPHWFKEEDPGGAGVVVRKYSNKFGNLEKKRLTNDEGYEKTHEALVRYVENSYKRIAHSKRFGQNDEVLDAAFTKAQREGYSRHELENLYNTANKVQNYHPITKAILQGQAYTHLQKSFIPNVTQGIQTNSIAGFKAAGKAYKQMANSTDRDWAASLGEAGDYALNAAQEAFGNSSGYSNNPIIRKIKKHILVPGMQATEKFNRDHAALTGRQWAKDLHETISAGGKGAKLATRQLKELVPDWKEGTPLTDAHLRTAGHNLIKRTQFLVDPLDIPKFASTDVGKLVFQFRSFGYRNTKFVTKEVLLEAGKGNFAPLARYIGLGVPVMGLAAGAKQALNLQTPFQAKDDNGDAHQMSIGEVLGKGAGDLVNSVSGISDVLNAKDAVSYNRGEDADRKILAAGGSVLGPTASDVVEGLNDARSAANGNMRPTAKSIVRRTPVLGATLSNMIFKSSADGQRWANAMANAKESLSGKENAGTLAAFNAYMTRNKNPQTGNTIQLSPSQSMDNAHSLYDNDKLRRTIQQFEKDSNKSHDPMWDLSDSDLKKFMQYQAQYTGDAAKTVLHDRATLPDGSNWIDDLRKARNKFYDNKDISGHAEPNVKTPKFPTVDKDTSELMATYGAADANGKAVLMDTYGDKITKYFNDFAKWTNEMRKSEGAPEKNNYPVASEKAQRAMDTYFSLPTHDGKRGGNASRSAWIASHPDDYKEMQSFMSQQSLYTLINEASKAQFVGTQPSQKLLKAIKNVGSNSVATYTDKEGNTVYGINSGDAYSQNRSGGSYGRSGGKKSGAGINQYGYMVKRGGVPVRLKAPSAPKPKSITVAKAKVSKPKVALKKVTT